jgi:hypothetical protein
MRFFDRSLPLFAGALLTAACTLGGKALPPAGTQSLPINAASTSTWQNFSMPPMTVPFMLDFDAIPSANGINALTSIASGAASNSDNGAVVLRFTAGGAIDASNGAGFGALQAVPYAGGTSYHFRVSVDPAAHTYSAIVTPDGDVDHILASGFAFASSEAGASSLDDIGIEASAGSHAVSNVRLTLPIGTQGGPGPDAGQPAPPAPASNLTAQSASSSSVQLQWSESSSGVTGFTIQRRATHGSAGFAPVGQVAGTVTQYLDTGLTTWWQYDYQIVAFNSAGAAAPSNTVTVQVLAVADGGTSGPVISSFGASPSSISSGQSATLQWSVSGATRLTIDQGVGDVSSLSSATVSPAQTTTYALTASDASGQTATATATVSVSAGGFRATLDCASSTQPAICQYVSQAAVPLSPPAAISSACQNVVNPVAVNPGNFTSVLANIQAGQTAVFAPGTYQGSAQLFSGVNYCGQPGDPSQVVIQASGFAFYGPSGGSLSNVVIEGLTLDGGGIKFDNYSNVFIQNNVLQNIRGNAVGASIWVPTAQGLTIARNKFINTDAIAAWTLADAVIADNSFSRCDEGFALAPGVTTPSTNVRVARNVFVEGHRIMIELQNSDTGLLVEDNAIVFPLNGGYPDTYGMGISMATPAAQTPILRNNWLFGPVGNYQTLGVLALELAGTNAQISGNVLQFWNAGTSISYNGPTMSLTQNSYCDLIAFLTQDGGFNGWPGTNSGNVCAKGSNGYAMRAP